MDTRATTPAGRGRTFNLLHTAPSLSSSSSVASSLIPEFFTYSKGKYGITYHYVDTRRMLIFPLNRFKKLQSPTYSCASYIRWSCTRTAADASHSTSQVMYLLMSLHLLIVLKFSQVFNLFHLVSYYRMQFVRNEHLLLWTPWNRHFVSRRVGTKQIGHFEQHSAGHHAPTGQDGKLKKIPFTLTKDVQKVELLSVFFLALFKQIFYPMC